MDNLQQYLDSVRHTPYQWGEHDCALMTAKYIDAQHGTMLVRRIKQFAVKSAKDYRALQRAGHSLFALTIAELGQPSTEEIQEGDVVLLKAGPHKSLGLASPPVIFCAGAHGIVPAPLRTAICFWRVR